MIWRKGRSQAETPTASETMASTFKAKREGAWEYIKTMCLDRLFKLSLPVHFIAVIPPGFFQTGSDRKVRSATKYHSHLEIALGILEYIVHDTTTYRPRDRCQTLAVTYNMDKPTDRRETDEKAGCAQLCGRAERMDIGSKLGSGRTDLQGIRVAPGDWHQATNVP